MRDDRETLARWVADPNEPRPKAAAPAIAQQTEELTDERDALTRAMQFVLDEKRDHVNKHRGRLRPEGFEARAGAAQDFLDAITLVEQTRAEVGCIAAEH